MIFFFKYLCLSVVSNISHQHFLFTRQSASSSYLSSSQQALRKEETFDINDLSVSDYDVGKTQTRRPRMNMQFLKLKNWEVISFSLTCIHIFFRMWNPKNGCSKANYRREHCIIWGAALASSHSYLRIPMWRCPPQPLLCRHSRFENFAIACALKWSLCIFYTIIVFYKHIQIFFVDHDNFYD